MSIQQSLFDDEISEFKIDNEIRLIELFAGMGTQYQALKRLGCNVKSWFCCEFDKYAIQAFNAIHKTNYEPSDVRNIHAENLNIIDDNKSTYILTYSFPCTDLSIAGKQEGMKKGSGTRSGLLWEVERLLTECNELRKKDKTFRLPQVLLMENVDQIISKKNIDDFNDWISFLNKFGYSSFYDIMNSKEFGVPQNRKRCFMISILGDWNYEFPEKMPLRYCMADLLEDEVDEKYFINSERAETLIQQLIVDKKIPELQ